jgi:hypothetical protein
MQRPLGSFDLRTRAQSRHRARLLGRFDLVDLKEGSFRSNLVDIEATLN